MRTDMKKDGSGSKSGALETILSDLGTFLAEFESDPGDPGGEDTGDDGVFGGSPSSCRQDLASTGHTIFFDEVAKRGEVYDAPTIRDGTEPHRKATRYKRHPVGFGIKGWWKMVVFLFSLGSVRLRIRLFRTERGVMEILELGN
jgi:hypothetical protein